MSQLSIISKRAKLGLVDGAQKLKWVKTSSRSLSLEMVAIVHLRAWVSPQRR